MGTWNWAKELNKACNEGIFLTLVFFLVLGVGFEVVERLL